MPIRIYFLAGILFLLPGFTPAKAVLNPTEQVRETVDNILAILRDKSLDWHSRQRNIEAIIDARFDFQSMSQSVLAKHWKKATPMERQQFVEFFSQYLDHVYITKMEKYTDEYVKYGAEKVNGDRATVDTFIVTKTVDIPVTYKLKRNSDEWYAYDVVIENVSLVNNYRSVYSAIIQTDGMGGLLDNLEQTNQQFGRQ